MQWSFPQWSRGFVYLYFVYPCDVVWSCLAVPYNCLLRIFCVSHTLLLGDIAELLPSGGKELYVCLLWCVKCTVVLFRHAVR